MKKNTHITTSGFSLTQFILGAIAIAIAVAVSTAWALTGQGQQRADKLFTTIQSAGASLSGPDLADYYDIVNFGLQESIDVLQNVQSRIGHTPIGASGNSTGSNGSSSSNPNSGTNNSAGTTGGNTANSCKWQYHAVFGPVGATNIDPNTTACTTSNNGTKAVEVGSRGQVVATCSCTVGTSPATGTTGTNITSCPGITMDAYVVPTGTNGQVKAISKTVGSTTYTQDFKCEPSTGWYKRGNPVTTTNGTTGTTGPTGSTGANGSTTTANSCKWQYHAIAGPVGPTNADPRTTACSPSSNGTLALEIGTGRKAATCICDPGTTGATTTTGANGSTTTANSCKWQSQAVFGPVGPVDIDIRTTACTTSNNGAKAMELSNAKQVTAICSCTGVTPPLPVATVNPGTNGSTTANSCKWQYHAVFGPVGATSIDPNTTACTTSNNGTKSVELGSRGQTVATCACTGVTPTTSAPKTVWSTSANLSPLSSTNVTKGATLYGYIDGGDINNTWACLVNPNNPNGCTNGADFRQLTKNYEGQADGWQVNNGRIEFRIGLSTSGLPAGEYIGYARTGQYGNDLTQAKFVIVGGQTAVTSAPKTIWAATPNLSPLSNGNVSMGSTLYGYIDGGDVNNTWACLTSPNNPNGCTNGSDYRQLTKPSAGQPDGWQISNGRIEFRSGLSTTGLPLGEYVGYARTGQYGTDTTQTRFIIVGGSGTNGGGSNGNSNGQK